MIVLRLYYVGDLSIYLLNFLQVSIIRFQITTFTKVYNIGPHYRANSLQGMGEVHVVLAFSNSLLCPSLLGSQSVYLISSTVEYDAKGEYEPFQSSWP